MEFPASHYVRAANALGEYAGRCEDLAAQSADWRGEVGGPYEALLAEAARTRRVAEDFRRAARAAHADSRGADALDDIQRAERIDAWQ